MGAMLAEWGEPSFRAKQLYRGLYVNRVRDVGAMTDLAKGLRQRLADACALGSLDLDRMEEGDAGLTRKASFQLPTGEHIESVLIVYPDRATVCVSSQAGCPMGCVFCATAKLGFLRDLTAGQIVEQVLWAHRELDGLIADRPGERLPRAITNVVFMGMGESFNNYDAWWESVERLHDPEGYNLGARNFTVSTVGLPPGIRRLATESLPINLAISLHAVTDEERAAIMPVNKAYPIAELLAAARDYARQTGRRVSFEYVLLAEKNDEPWQAEALATLLAEGPMGDCRTLMHVNLIPWNPVPGTPLARSSRTRVQAFRAVLRSRGIPCTVRVERGVDIGAACGQLAGSGRWGGEHRTSNIEH